LRLAGEPIKEGRQPGSAVPVGDDDGDAFHYAVAPWRTHSCVPRRQSCRRLVCELLKALAGVRTRHARVRAPRIIFWTR
jgi:hypothetical protein